MIAKKGDESEFPELISCWSAGIRNVLGKAESSVSQFSYDASVQACTSCAATSEAANEADIILV